MIETLYDMAERYDRKIMVRLVKGAYWDTEIKLAQEMGVARYTFGLPGDGRGDRAPSAPGPGPEQESLE